MANKKAASAGNGTVSVPQIAPERAPERAASRPRRAPAARRTKPSRKRAAGKRTAMSVNCRLAASEPLEERLRNRVIGQDEAIDALVCSWARLLSGLRDPERPLLSALLLGPTGVGKTETAKALAEALFGSSDALTRIDCEEYAHGHEVAKLLGSPPGYVGSDVEPLLSQQRIDKPHWRARQAHRSQEDAPPLLIDEVHDPEEGLHSIVLFDEIEKAHPILWNSLLGILDDGRLTLGNNRTTDLTRSVILMTSNVGSRQMSAALDHRTVGFVERDRESADAATLGQIAHAAAHDIFPIEFLNRFDQVLAYSPLQPEQLGAIFDKFLAEIGQRALDQAGVPMLIQVAQDARRFVIDEGTDPRLGARPLRRAMERYLVDPLSRLIASGQLTEGDVVEVELDEREGLAFFRLPRRSKHVVA